MPCNVDNPLLSGPPGGHGGGHGGGHHGGGGGGHAGRRGGRGGWGWWGGGPWSYDTVVDTTTTCSSWGFPVPMTPDLDSIGKRLLASSDGQPASAYHAGVLYLFSFQDGVIRARPCASTSSTLGDAPAAMYFLYRRTGAGQWAPVTGAWQSVADAEAQMTAALSASPTAQLGAYAWDGQSVTWRFF